MHAANINAVPATAEWTVPRASSFFFWPFLILATFLVLDPTNPGLNTGMGNLRLPRDLGPLKYTALFLGWAVPILSLAGLKMTRPDVFARVANALSRSWPILLFMLVVFGGSLYARLALDIKETFLPAAISMTAYYIGLTYVAEARDPRKVVRAYFTVLLCVAPFMVGHIVLRWIRGGHAFHEEIFLLVPLAVYCFLAFGQKFIAWTCVIGFTGIAVLSYKNTSYLVALLTLGYLFFILVRQKFIQYRSDSLMRIMVAYALTLLFVIAIAGLIFAFFQFQERLPSGNTEVRMHAYKHAWEKFLSSPAVGTMFAGDTHVSFSRFLIAGQRRVITHSDYLDVLAHSGIVGCILFLMAYLTPLRLGLFKVDPSDVRLRAAVHGLRVVFFGGLVVMMFNPVMLNLPLNSFFWLNAGMMAGLGACFREKTSSPHSESQYENRRYT